MKLHHFFIIVSLLFICPLTAQPPETIYLGTVVQDGYVDDESYGPFDIGFTFNFYGNDYAQFYISSNGQILFGAGSLAENEAPIPTVKAPNNFIAPFWDDLVVDSYGKILYRSIGAASNRKLIVQFKNMGFYPAPANLGTFSVILYETSNVIQFQYRLIVLSYSAKAHGGDATIGLENADGTTGIEYAYHNPSAGDTEQAISFTPAAGPTYTVNSNALYDGVYLTTNLSLPEPGITTLISPPQDAVIGSDFTFEWASATNAASYTLYIGTDPELIGATPYPAGSNLTYDITGLDLYETYYWGVFSKNATGTTWCEIKRFPGGMPSCNPVPQTVWIEQGQDKIIQLKSIGCDAATKKAIITSLPAMGQLYQYDEGFRIPVPPSPPFEVIDPEMRIVYAATGNNGNGAGNFNFKINDINGDSPEATITINVLPPHPPNVLYLAKSSTYIEIQFDIMMADPSGKQDQFTVKVDGSPIPLGSAVLKPCDPYSIWLNLETPLTGTETVLVSYMPGNITGTSGGSLFPFSDQPVTLIAQSINFPPIPAVCCNSCATLSATSSSGLPITYSSSNLHVATVSGNILCIHAIGTTDIIALQPGDATYAPAKCIRTITVSKCDQTITCSPLPGITYGDVAFDPGCSASSGLPFSYSSDDSEVATIVSGMVHIVGAGCAVITVSQAGNSCWNPATDVNLTLTVEKANQTITFGALPSKTLGDPDFDPGATSSSGLPISYLSCNEEVATIVEGKIHIVGVGTANIKASQSGNENYNPAPYVIQPLTVDIPTGLEDQVSQNKFNIYSANSLINILVLNDEWNGKTGNVRVVDLTGKTISNYEPAEFRTNSLIQIEAPISKGIYIVELRTGALRYAEMVVIR